MKLLIIIGMPGSGKTIAAKQAKKIGLFTIATGDIIREEVMNRGLLYNENTDQEISEWFHKYGRERELMRRIVDKIIEAGHPDPIVIDGLRSPDQINELKKRLWGEKIYILAIHSCTELRYKREKARPRFNGKPYRNIRKRDERELEQGLGNMIAMADHIIVNDTSLEQFKNTVKDKLIKILNIKR